MAQVSGPQNVGIPGYKLPPKPKPVVGPQNVGIVGGGIGGHSNPGSPAGIPLSVPVAVAPVAPPPAPPPPPPDFNQMTQNDPTYTQGIADLTRQNDYLTHDTLANYLRGSQSAQDNANAHGALFSGAAVNAQTQASDAYKTAGERQAANLLSARNQLYNSVYQRLLQQLAGGA